MIHPKRSQALREQVQFPRQCLSFRSNGIFKRIALQEEKVMCVGVRVYFLKVALWKVLKAKELCPNSDSSEITAAATRQKELSMSLAFLEPSMLKPVAIALVPGQATDLKGF